MPAMTMVFNVTDPAILEDMTRGATIEFVSNLRSPKSIGLGSLSSAASAFRRRRFSNHCGNAAKKRHKIPDGYARPSSR